jgi:hypothetical protein
MARFDSPSATRRNTSVSRPDNKRERIFTPIPTIDEITSTSSRNVRPHSDVPQPVARFHTHPRIAQSALGPRAHFSQIGTSSSLPSSLLHKSAKHPYGHVHQAAIGSLVKAYWGESQITEQKRTVSRRAILEPIFYENERRQTRLRLKSPYKAERIEQDRHLPFVSLPSFLPDERRRQLCSDTESSAR